MSSALNKIRTTIQLIFSLGKTLGNVMRFDFNQKTIRLFVKVNAFIFVFSSNSIVSRYFWGVY